MGWDRGGGMGEIVILTRYVFHFIRENLVIIFIMLKLLKKLYKGFFVFILLEEKQLTFFNRTCINLLISDKTSKLYE